MAWVAPVMTQAGQPFVIKQNPAWFAILHLTIDPWKGGVFQGEFEK
jgi:hypothetical protein